MKKRMISCAALLLALLCSVQLTAGCRKTENTETLPGNPPAETDIPSDPQETIASDTKPPETTVPPADTEVPETETEESPETEEGPETAPTVGPEETTITETEPDEEAETSPGATPTLSLQDPTAPTAPLPDGSVTWYLYQMTTDYRCFWDVAERPVHSGYIQPGTFCEDPWFLLETYTPEAEDASITGVTDGRYVIHDGTWFLYDCNTGIREALDFVPAEADTVKALATREQEIIGYAVEKAGRWGYYDLMSERFTVDCEWNDIHYDGAGDYLSAATGEDEAALAILHRKTGENLGSLPQGSRVLAGEVTFFLAAMDGGEAPFWQIYRENLTTPISPEVFTMVTMCTDGSLIAVPAATAGDNFCRTFMVFDSQGKLVRQSANYSSILFAEGDWIAVNRDNRLLLLDREENVMADFDKWSRHHKLYWTLSGHKNSMVQTGEVPPLYRFTYMEWEDDEYVAHMNYAAPAGLYLLVEDGNIDEGVSGHGKWYFYAPDTGTVGRILWGSLGGYREPALNRVG